jgi:hypothetical protein
VQKGWIKYIFPCKTNAPILATFDTNPSPHRRFNDPSLLLAFAHIHGEAGTPTEGIGSALWVGTVCFYVCMCRRGGLNTYFPAKQTPLFSLHSTPPRLRISDSMHLVCFWLSPTSMARLEHQRRASAVHCGSERSVSVSVHVQKGWIITSSIQIKRPHSRYI